MLSSNSLAAFSSGAVDALARSRAAAALPATATQYEPSRAPGSLPIAPPQSQGSVTMPKPAGTPPRGSLLDLRV
jgi:hypothetical protein